MEKGQSDPHLGSVYHPDSRSGAYFRANPTEFANKPVEPTKDLEITSGIPAKLDADGNLWEQVEGANSPWVLTETLEDRDPDLYNELYPKRTKLDRKDQRPHPGR